MRVGRSRSRAQVGEPEVSHSVLFPTFLQPLSNALRVFKRDKPRERWRPVGRPPLALSSQLEANGLAFGGAVFDTPLATVVEQRPLQRPTPPRKQVQRRRWCCPELGWSTASAIFSSWCAKSGGAASLERSGRRMIAMPARWLHRSAVVVPAWLRWSAHDSRISATFVDGTTTFGRTARARLKEPMQPENTLLTARARFARCTGFQVLGSSPSSRNGAITTLSKAAAMTQSRPCFISNRTQIAMDFFVCT